MSGLSEMGEIEMRATYWGDLYGSAALRDPYPAYEKIRNLGSAVWMPRRRLWAVGRYEDVRDALRADDRLLSGKGVAANNPVNRQAPPITLTSDGDTHTRRRKVLMQPVMPGPLNELRPRLEEIADRLVNELAAGEQFDAIGDFAAHLPVTVVAELVGLNAFGRERMLSWAASTFNALGVMNLRGLRSMPALLDLGKYVRALRREDVTPDGWADRLFAAAEQGQLSRAEANAMVIDYVAPALDTTILATGHMVWLLANRPEAYEALRAEPELIPGVVNETVRLASPIRGFTRHAAEDVDIGEQTVPAGSRVLILFASANHDERHYARPQDFDIRRNPRDHVGWGHGAHTCVGMHLARLEMEILLTSLVRRVSRIEAGKPVYLRNNVLQGFEKLPARFYPD